jgi:hypothetical protein
MVLSKRCILETGGLDPSRGTVLPSEVYFSF